MLLPFHRSIIGRLIWPQFHSILKVFQIDEALFNRQAPPAQWILTFENEIQNLADAEGVDQPSMQERITQTLRLKLGASADVEMVKQGSIEAGKGFSEIADLLNDPGQKNTVVTILRQAGNTFQNLELNLRALFTCKEAHAALHDLSFKLSVLMDAARDLQAIPTDSPKRGQLNFELRRASGGCLDDVQRFGNTVQNLPPPSDSTFEQISELLKEAIEEVRNAAADPNGDPVPPITSVLQPMTRQQPSKIQELISFHVRELPFDPVINVLQGLNFSTKEATLVSLSNLRDSTANIEKVHRDWQLIDNQTRLMEDPIEKLATSPTNRRSAALVLKLLRRRLDAHFSESDSDSLGGQILELAESVRLKLDDAESDIWDLRADVDELLRLCSAHFYAIDESLLDACREMEPLCDPLRHLANSI